MTLVADLTNDVEILHALCHGFITLERAKSLLEEENESEDTDHRDDEPSRRLGESSR